MMKVQLALRQPVGGVVDDHEQRITQLEGAVAAQQGEIERLRAERRRPQAAAAPQRSSRRMMIKGGAIAAGAALAAAAARPEQAAASHVPEVQVGHDNVGVANTRVRSTSGGTLNDANIFTVSDNAFSSGFEAAIGAVAQGVRVTNGVYAFTDARVSDSSSTGHAVVARRTTGGRSNVYMPPSGSAPTSDSYNHYAGELRVDFSGQLWYCVGSGVPGTWRRLAASASAGAIHALVPPRRMYDSRLTGGALSAGSERIVSMANAIDVDTGAITVFDAVPPGATAVFFNLAITQTSGGGFLQVAPGNATTVTAATINWDGAGVTLSNASFSSLDSSRQVKVLSGGSGATHFIIDVTGYTL